MDSIKIWLKSRHEFYESHESPQYEHMIGYDPHGKLWVSLLTYHSEHAGAYSKNTKSLYTGSVRKYGVW